MKEWIRRNFTDVWASSVLDTKVDTGKDCFCLRVLFALIVVSRALCWLLEKIEDAHLPHAIAIALVPFLSSAHHHTKF